MTNPLDRLQQAKDAFSAGRLAAALKRLRGAWPKLLADEAAFLSAECLRQQGYFKKARGLYEKALRAGFAQDPELWASCGLGLAAALRSLGETAGARRAAAGALALAGRRGLGQLAEDLRLELLMIDRAEERYGKVIPRFHAQARRAARARDFSKAAYLLWAAAGAERFDGRLADSEKTFRGSLRLAGRAQDGSGRIYALFGLGGVTRIRGRLGDSEKFYRQAGRLLAGTDDVFGKAYAECGLANSLRQQGRLEEARRHYLRAHVLYSSLDDGLDLAYVDWGLGKIALQEGRLKESAARLRKALKAFEQGGETRGIVLARLALAAALHAQGLSGQAEKFFESGWRLARSARIHAHLEVYT